MRVARNIRLLAWFHFWGEFRPYGPIAILYFAQVSGSSALGMSVFSVTRLAQSVFEVPTGILSDLIGRKQTVVWGSVASVLAIVCYALGGTYATLLAGAILEGIARAFFSGNNEALLYDTLAQTGQAEKYQETLGKILSGYQVALAVSALLGGVIASASFQLVMWVSVIPMVLALIVSLMLVAPQPYRREDTNIYAHLRTSLRLIVRNPQLRLLSLASVWKFAVGESAWLFRAAFIERLWPVWALGLSQLLGNTTGALGFYFAGRAIRRFGELGLLVSGGIVNQAMNLVALLFPGILSPLLMSLNGIFYGFETVTSGGLIQRAFTDEQRATMGSLTSLAGSIAFAGFSFLLGALADRWGVVAALIFATLLLFVPIALYQIALRPASDRALRSDP